MVSVFNKIKHVCSWVLLCLLVVTNVVFASEETDVNQDAVASQIDAVKKLQVLLTSLDSVQASFRQTTLDSHGNFLQEVVGSMKAKKPGFFYWNTLPPMEQLLVTNGDRLWLYDPDLEQVTVKALDKRLSATPALILNGNVDDIGSEYHITAASINADSWRFMLQPKDPESLFEGLRLTFERGVLVEMFLEDGLGQKTSIIFHDIDQTTLLDDSIFTFQPPEGVDIISDYSSDVNG